MRLGLSLVLSVILCGCGVVGELERPDPVHGKKGDTVLLDNSVPVVQDETNVPTGQ